MLLSKNLPVGSEGKSEVTVVYTGERLLFVVASTTLNVALKSHVW